MNGWKVSFWVTLLLLVLSNVFWAVVVIDNAVTATYRNTAHEDVLTANDLLGRLVVEGGKHYSMQDITHILRQMKPDAFIVEEANTVKAQNVTFIFKDGVLVQVQ